MGHDENGDWTPEPGEPEPDEPHKPEEDDYEWKTRRDGTIWNGGYEKEKQTSRDGTRYGMKVVSDTKSSSEKDKVSVSPSQDPQNHFGAKKGDKPVRFDG